MLCPNCMKIHDKKIKLRCVNSVPEGPFIQNRRYECFICGEFEYTSEKMYVRGWVSIPVDDPDAELINNGTQKDTEETRIEAFCRRKNITYIYFIQNPADNTVKIGRSCNPEGRFRQLQGGSAHELKMLFVFKANLDKEIDLHDRFKKDRMGGEWFKFSDEILDYIDKKMAKCQKNR